MDKFIIRKRVRLEKAVYYRVRVHKEEYDILHRLRDQTGQNMSDILNSMIRFCNERLEIVEPDQEKGDQS